MAILGLGEYNSSPPSYTASGQHGKLQIDTNGALKVKDCTGQYASGSELVVAGAASVLGKLATQANSAVVYIRADGSDCRDIDWRVSSDVVYTLQKYKTHSIVDSVGVTLNAIADTNTIIINGLTYTIKADAANANYASRHCRCDAASNDLDAVELAKVINADYAVITAGTSIAATDSLVFTTDEGTTTIVAADSADYPNHQYLAHSTVGTELASIVLAINHRDNVTCTTGSAVGETVTVGNYTFTGGAAEDLTARTWHADSGNATTAATSLAACINSATYGPPGITAVASGAVVSMWRDAEQYEVGLVTSDDTLLAVELGGGVEGVSAVATGYTGQLAVTPTWTKTLTITETGDQLAVTDIDCPGVLATPGTALVTLTPGTPAGVEGDLASTIQVTATATRFVVSQAATLAALIVDGDVVTDAAATTGAGKLYSQTMRGWEYGYLGITNKSGGAAQTLVVGATKII